MKKSFISILILAAAFSFPATLLAQSKISLKVINKVNGPEFETALEFVKHFAPKTDNIFNWKTDAPVINNTVTIYYTDSNDPDFKELLSSYGGDMSKGGSVLNSVTALSTDGTSTDLSVFIFRDKTFNDPNFDQRAGGFVELVIAMANQLYGQVTRYLSPDLSQMISCVIPSNGKLNAVNDRRNDEITGYVATIEFINKALFELDRPNDELKAILSKVNKKDLDRMAEGLNIQLIDKRAQLEKWENGLFVNSDNSLMAMDFNSDVEYITETSKNIKDDMDVINDAMNLMLAFKPNKVNFFNWLMGKKEYNFELAVTKTDDPVFKKMPPLEHYPTPPSVNKEKEPVIDSGTLMFGIQGKDGVYIFLEPFVYIDKLYSEETGKTEKVARLAAALAGEFYGAVQIILESDYPKGDIPNIEQQKGSSVASSIDFIKKALTNLNDPNGCLNLRSDRDELAIVLNNILLEKNKEMEYWENYRPIENTK